MRQVRKLVIKLLGLGGLLESIVTLDAELEQVREAHAALTTQNAILEDRLTMALDDRKSLWALLQDTINGERHAYQGAINQSWQKQGFGVPYPDAPHIPPAGVPRNQPAGVIGHNRVMPSQQVNAATAKFIEDYYAGGGKQSITHG